MPTSQYLPDSNTTGNRTVPFTLCFWFLKFTQWLTFNMEDVYLLSRYKLSCDIYIHTYIHTYPGLYPFSTCGVGRFLALHSQVPPRGAVSWVQMPGFPVTLYGLFPAPRGSPSCALWYRGHSHCCIRHDKPAQAVCSMQVFRCCGIKLFQQFLLSDWLGLMLNIQQNMSVVSL